MARPEKPIDWKQFEFLALTPNSTQETIADALGIHRDTLRDRFQEEYGMSFTAYSTQRKQCGRTLFESQQLQRALKGNSQMLMWLGKVWYGQKEAESKEAVPREEVLLLEDELLKLKAKIRQIENESKPEAGTEL